MQPSRAGRLPLTAPVKQKQDAERRLREAALEYRDADEDEDFERAQSQLLKAAEGYAASKGKGGSWSDELAARIKAGLARRRRAGGRVGAKPKLDRLGAEHAVKVAGSIKKAAEMLGVDRDTVSAALRRPAEQTESLPHGVFHVLPVPARGEADEHPPDEGEERATREGQVEEGVRPERG